MIRTLSLFIFIMFGAGSSHAATACNTTPSDKLPTIHENVSILCRSAYISAYDNSAKVPLWVAYTVEPRHAIGCFPRLDRFLVDYALAERYRSAPSDYADSGYDIGHLADASTMSFDQLAEYESFLLSNTAPQTPNFNRGIWKLLELKIRVWAYSGRTMRVYTGTIWNSTSETIGNGVVVPDKFYKVVVDIKTGQSLAFLFNNEPQSSKNLADFAVSVADIESASGISFPVDNKNSKYLPWPGNSKILSRDKHKVCVLNRLLDSRY